METPEERLSYYQAHKEALKIRAKQYYQAHRAQANARSMAWAAAHPDRMKEIIKKSVAKRKDKLRAAARRRYHANPERMRALDRLRRSRDPERYAEYKRRTNAKARLAGRPTYYQSHPEFRDRINTNRRRVNSALRERAANHYQAWTDREHRFVVENPQLAPKEIALILGRTLWSVLGRRRLIKNSALTGPTTDGNVTP
jgi:hypothetical protein